jgi:signal transduction histidine kinase
VAFTRRVDWPLPSGQLLERRTVRLRLTLLFGSLFLLSGAALLAITYVLFRHATDNPVVVTTKTRSSLTSPPPGRQGSPLPTQSQVQAEAERDRERAQRAADREHAHELRQLLLQSGIALALMAVVSIALGWLVAGRVLRPLRTITATTRRISQHNLHERLAMPGPSDELKDLADTIDGLLARLEAAFTAQRRFVANASHELRTPLAMMRTSLDVAAGKRGPPPPQLVALDAKLREGLDQADRLLENFLTLARAQNGALPEPTTVALAELLCSAIDARADRIADAHIAVTRSLVDVQVVGSEPLLARMVENVVDNAVRHNERSGWIHAETQGDGETARLVLANGGPRLEEAKVRELGQPFRRLVADRTGSQDGLGLGLSIVAAIAEAHGGTSRLTALADGGLQVLIELPRATARAVAKEAV